MIKTTDIIGLDVITINEGKKVASIKDVIYDQGAQKILALLLDEGGLFVDPHVILLSDIKNVGKDALMIQSAEDIRSTADVDKIIRTIAKDKIFLTKTRMVTTGGENLGNISDLYFDPFTGNVTEIEFIQSLNNLASAKKRVKIHDIVSVGQDATVVKAEILEDIEKSGNLEKTSTKTSTIWQQIKDLLTTTAQKAQGESSLQNNFRYTAHEIKKPKDKSNSGKRIEQFNHQLTLNREEILDRYNQARNRINDRRKQDAVGKYLTKTILSRKDEVLGKRGDMVTNKLLIAAEKDGIVDQILKNTTDEPLSKES